MLSVEEGENLWLAPSKEENVSPLMASKKQKQKRQLRILYD